MHNYITQLPLRHTNTTEQNKRDKDIENEIKYCVQKKKLSGQQQTKKTDLPLISINFQAMHYHCHYHYWSVDEYHQ